VESWLEYLPIWGLAFSLQHQFSELKQDMFLSMWRSIMPWVSLHVCGMQLCCTMISLMPFFPHLCAAVEDLGDQSEDEEDEQPRRTRAALAKLGEARARRAQRGAAAAVDDDVSEADEASAQAGPATRPLEGRRRLRKAA
jgi:hypothetical protein